MILFFTSSLTGNSLDCRSYEVWDWFADTRSMAKGDSSVRRCAGLGLFN